MAIGEGTLLAGRYRLGPVIGRGGISEVHDGRDLRLERPVAVKLLSVEDNDHPHLGRHFERDAGAVGRLAHPHVVEIFDVGESEGRPYLVMERLTGGNLAHRLGGGPLDQDQVRQLAGELLGALAAAHAAGILHQDIKPSNILFSTDGSAKVADFGIAQEMEHLSSGLPGEPTDTNVIIGTPAYLAPERFRGLPATPRSDLWSVGVVLYEALAGVKPFVGKSDHAVGYAVTRQQPVPLDWWRPELDPALVAAVHRALEKRPEQRFASAAEMGAAIGTSVTGSPIPTDEDRAWSEDLDTAIGTEGAAPVGQGRDPQHVVSGLVGLLVVARKIHLRRRTPLLAGALVVLALSALGGVLISGRMTSSPKGPALANSPTTAPVTTPQTTAPITAPPTTVPITTPPTTAPIIAPPTTSPVTTPQTTAPIIAPPTTSPVTTAQTTTAIIAPPTTTPVTTPPAAAPVIAPPITVSVIAPPTTTPITAPPTTTPIIFIPLVTPTSVSPSLTALNRLLITMTRAGSTGP